MSGLIAVILTGGTYMGLDLTETKVDYDMVHALEHRCDSLERHTALEKQRLNQEIKFLTDVIGKETKDREKLESAHKDLWLFVDDRNENWSAGATTAKRNARIIDKHH